MTVRRLFHRRHSIKWAALGGLLAGATALTQFIPESWPTWLSASLTALAFVATGVSSFISPDSNA